MEKMGRLNEVMKQQEKVEKQKKKKEKKRSTSVPIYGVDGQTLVADKKRSRKKLILRLFILLLFLGSVYLPQFILKDTDTSDEVEVELNGNAVSINANVSKSYPDEDFDNDGLENSEETNQSTSSYYIDTDGDGLTDYCELYITKTSPTSANEDYLVDEQKELDSSGGKSMESPYKIGNVILWADDYTSKAYGSVVETTLGYRFSNFSGYAQFPDVDGKYLYQVKDGARTELEYREEEDVYKIEPYTTVEIYDEPLDTTADIGLFGHHFYVADNRATEVISTILPDKGWITAQIKTTLDVDPDTRDNTTTDIVEIEYDSTDDTRFQSNTNTLNDLQYVRQTIEEGNCVLVSLYKSGEGEYVGEVYGYTYEGDLLIADPSTKEPIGTLTITEQARKIMNAEGAIVSYTYFDFSGFGFSSENQDRISFFATSGDNGYDTSTLNDSDDTSEGTTTDDSTVAEEETTEAEESEENTESTSESTAETTEATTESTTTEATTTATEATAATP